MSETVKLIIEIPKESLNLIKTFKGKFICNGDDLIQVIKNGIPLDDVKAEIEALSNANPSYWHSGDMVEREEVLEILGNIGKGDKERVL